MTGKSRTANPVISGILSAILPGAGQMYCGEWKRGITLLLGLSTQAALFYGSGLSSLIFWLILIWIWNIYDAAKASKNVRLSAFIPVILILALNLYASGKVTQIQIPNLGPQQRRVMRQIGGGMVNPDFATRKAIEQTADAKFVIPGSWVKPYTPMKPTAPGKPHITISPTTASTGETISVIGSNFISNQEGKLVIVSSNETTVGSFKTDSNGKFKASFKNPREIPGDYFVEAIVKAPVGGFTFSETLQVAAPLMFQTIYLALLGTAISLVFAIPFSFFGARNLMSRGPLKILYGVTRGLFTILRSVEVLIIAVIAVAAVGIGPFAGVIALALHGVGALGKLYSESIESIEHGPIEAIRSTGANEFQVVLFGVVPQVVPQFIAFTLYRWDINVRMATVIGLVGGGGIGYKLIEYMNLLQWRQAATAIWMIAGVVMLMDYASAIIREKLI